VIGNVLREFDSTQSLMMMLLQGIVLLREGTEADATLDALYAEIAQLDQHQPTPGVNLVPYLDSSDLVHRTTHTVCNLTDGVTRSTSRRPRQTD